MVKFTAAILLVACLQVSALGYSQTVTLSEKNAPLEKLFGEIEKQTGYSFLYSSEVLKQARRVDIRVHNGSLEKALDICFSNQPLTWKIEGKTVIVKPKSEGPNALPPPVDVWGKIVNENHQPVGGASIQVKGTKVGAITDEGGNFLLRRINEDALLVISGTNIETKEVKLTGRFSPVLILVDTKVVGLATVEVGYGRVNRKDLTGSVASVNVEEVKNAPFVSIDQALAGKAAGVQVVQADGSPGGMARIRIRGGSSLIGGNDPLYIIDGVQVAIQNSYIQGAADIVNPVERLGNDKSYANSAVGSSFARGLNTLAGLNMNDIETIDILKDASATAIYGSRAANGVVIITTKKGKRNMKPMLEANYYAGFSKAITEKVLNATQYKAVMLEGAKNLVTNRTAQGRPVDGRAPAIINNPDFLGTANTNWLDLVTRTGITHNADLSIKGGGTSSRYYTSLAYMKQTGTLLGTDFSRISGKVSLDNEITSRLRVITNLDYGFTRNNITNGIYASAMYAPPTLPAFNPDGSVTTFDEDRYWIDAYSGIQNPMAMLQGINRSKTLSLIGSLAVEYDILKSLKFRSTASANYRNYHQLNYAPSVVSVSTNDGQTIGSSKGGIATQAQSQQADVFYENTLTWDKQFDPQNRLTLLLGTSWQQSNSQYFSASGQGFPDDKYLNGLSSAALALPPQARETQSSLLSFYLRANYAFREKYLLTITGRSDASSKFPKANRVGYFPSFGIAWKINEEPFLKSATWINELKIRASAGYTGTQNIADNLFYTLFTPASYASTNALVPTQLGNDRIKWESTLQKDAGVDFALFNSRLRGAIAYYHKQTSGLLMALPVATSSGFNAVLVNVADIRNKGLEIDLRGDIIRSKKAAWNVAVNVSGNRSMVTRINRDLQNPRNLGYSDPFWASVFSIGNTVLREGYPVGLIYGYQYRGVIKTQKELDDYKAATNGSLRYLALGDPMYAVIDTGLYKGEPARDIIGKAEPTFYGGITNTISYKSLSLITLFTFSYGGELLYLNDLRSLGLLDMGNRSTRVLLDHYSSSNPDADRPSLVMTESNGAAGNSNSSIAVHDASYIKLKSVSLNYELPQHLLRKWHLRTAMIYLSGSNLFCLTNYPGPDPEVSNDPYSLINGYSDAATYPSMRQYSVGVRFGF